MHQEDLQLPVDELLLNDFTQYYIHTHHCPPCAARTCAYLLFDFKREGRSFEHLLEFLKISKSTLSDVLKLLEERQLIRHYAHEGCRKRFFVINSTFVINRFNGIKQDMINEKALLERMLGYQKENGSENALVEARFGTLIDIFDKNITTFQEGIEKLSRIN